MHRIGYAVMIFGIAIFTHHTYAFCKICNVSEMMEKGRDPRAYYLRRSPNPPMARDVSYLPEEDYVEDREAKEKDRQRLDRDNRNLMPEYRNLCEIVTKRVRLDDSEYEYQPPHYHEIFCKNYSLLDDSERAVNNPPKQKCAHPGFHCVQRSRTLLMVRRRWDSECWEPFTKEVASGCDCMWPVSLLGDITAHY